MNFSDFEQNVRRIAELFRREEAGTASEQFILLIDAIPAFLTEKPDGDGVIIQAQHLLTVMMDAQNQQNYSYLAQLLEENLLELLRPALH